MTGCVYVMRSVAGGVKIGRSATPDARLKALQSANSNSIVLCHVTGERADAAAIERVAHKLLSEKRLQGEWFDVSANEAIAAIVEATRVIDEAQRDFVSSPKKFAPNEGPMGDPFMLRLPDDLSSEIERIAGVLGCNKSAAIRLLLREGLKHFKP